MRFGRSTLASLLLPLSLAACGGGGDSSAPPTPTPTPAVTGAIRIDTISNRADLISGGDALVALTLPAGATAAGLRVDVGGRDVSGAFVQQADGRLLGLVEGLATGANVLTAATATAGTARLTITNAPSSGPVLSGAQAQPFFCATPAPEGATAASPLTNASGLSSRAAGPGCTIATEYLYYYRTTNACTPGIPDPSPATGNFLATQTPALMPPPSGLCFKPYTPGTTPADLARTTTDAGITLPFIVRVERGTLNRGIHDIAVLYDPARSGWSATAPQPQWNGKLELLFGGGNGQSHRQSRPSQSWTDERALGRGFMVATSSMLDSSANSNRVLMAETVMMLKERIVERYGPIRYTLAYAASGGAINANLNASIAPGQIDGMLIRSAFADAETNALEVGDCILLATAYQRPEWLAAESGLTEQQAANRKAAINGHVDQTGCHGWFNAYGDAAAQGNYRPRYIGRLSGDPETDRREQALGIIRTESGPLTNNCELPLALVYDAETNPGGTRCDGAGWAASIWGSAGNGPAQTRDNTGVQYGLSALLSGAITPEEFVLINELVGGLGRNGRITTARSLADPQALETAYRAGIVADGRRLAGVAILDLRGWNDSVLLTPPGLAKPADPPIHFVWRSFGIRARLVRDFGNSGNQALWRVGRFGLQPASAVLDDAFAQIDGWLSALAANGGTAPIAQRVRTARPAGAPDRCYLSSDAAQTPIANGAACDDDPFLRYYSSPRQVAGAPRTEDILKCQLRPFDAADYGGRLDASQLARMRTIFASGVCDWTKPGVGQQPSIGPLNFSAGPGGRSLPAPPVSG